MLIGAARVLNVADDVVNRRAVSVALRRAGYDVTEAACGEEALRLAREEPDVILLDVALPDIPGSEVCRRLRADRRTASISVIQLSAFGGEQSDPGFGVAEGADAYLSKPVEARELIATVGAVLRARRAEQQAWERARQWRATFDAIAESLCVLDCDGTVERCNDAATRLFGARSDAGIVGRDYRELLRSELGIVGMVKLEALVADPEPRSEEREVGDRWFRIGLDPIVDEAGRLDGAVLVLEDITDRKRLEDDLRERARELEIADERKDEFIAMLAHELRNPLGAIAISTEVMTEVDPDPRAEVVRPREIIARQVKNLARLVDDLLDVSRISRNKIELKRAPLDLRRCIETVAEATRGAVESAGHVLRTVLPEVPVVVDADATRVEQIVANLLDNAIKYTDRGGRIELALDTTVEDGEPVALVRVRDSGIGIPPERLPFIFDLFVQFDRTLDRARGGLGLGLTLVKRLTEMHGGCVDVSSDGPGHGTTFVVRLPMVPGAETRETRRMTTAPPKGKRKVLLVEDNADLRQLLAWKLRRVGHEVLEAGDGKEGLELARTTVPDAALVDVGLPIMNGYDVARALRGDLSTSRIHLIALTGYGARPDRERAERAGFEAHLVKPVALDDLLDLLERLPQPDDVAAQ